MPEDVFRVVSRLDYCGLQIGDWFSVVVLCRVSANKKQVVCSAAVGRGQQHTTPCHIMSHQMHHLDCSGAGCVMWHVGAVRCAAPCCTRHQTPDTTPDTRRQTPDTSGWTGHGHGRAASRSRSRLSLWLECSSALLLPDVHRPPSTAHRPPPTAHRPPSTAHRPPEVVARTACARTGHCALCTAYCGTRNRKSLKSFVVRRVPRASESLGGVGCPGAVPWAGTSERWQRLNNCALWLHCSLSHF